jgi:hypothetical protein
MEQDTNDMTVRSLICFGMGYTATALSQHVSLSKWSILGTKRNPETKFVTEHPNLQISKWPANDFELPERVDAVLISVPPNDHGCPVYEAFKDRFGPETWIGYLSSTGVYGDLRGGWAYEETSANPLSLEAKRRVIAETQWQGLGAHVFRLPGIYGPGRSALERVKSGRARRIVKHGQIFSRAHVSDIANALALSILSLNPGRIYNVCDDVPSPPEDVLTFAAQLLRIEPPPEIAYEDAGLSEKAQRFYMECKRVSNARLKAELGWHPEYPDYQTGLMSILRSQD